MKKEYSRKDYVAWSTEDEITFLDGLGKGIHSTKVFKPRRTLLIGYLYSFPHRVNWGNIDKTLVYGHAFSALKNER